MTIDRLLPEPWDPDTLAALERWRQGHLLSMDRGTWIVPAWVDDPVTGELSDGGPIGGVRARSAPLSDTGYAAVVSQTCDIGDLDIIDTAEAHLDALLDRLTEVVPA